MPKWLLYKYGFTDLFSYDFSHTFSPFLTSNIDSALVCHSERSEESLFLSAIRYPLSANSFRYSSFPLECRQIKDYVIYDGNE